MRPDLTRRFRTVSALPVLLLLLSIPGSAAASEDDRGPAVGAEAPAFTLEAISGGEVSLAELHDDGPAVVVFFRGTW